MRDKERERLYYLFQESKCPAHFLDNKQILDTTDYLLANGVIVPPCKVGDKTFLLLEKIAGECDIVESKCVKVVDNGYSRLYSMYFDCKEIGNSLEFELDDFDKTVFLTREKAEQKLKEGKG